MENKEKELATLLNKLMEWCKKYNENYVSMAVVDNSGYANTDPHNDNHIKIEILGENDE